MSDFEHRHPARIQSGWRNPGHAVEGSYQVESDPGWIDIGNIFGALRRNIWLILSMGAIGIGLAGYLVAQQVTRYRASAVIRLLEQRAAGDLTTTEDVPMGKPDPIMSELMVLKGRTVLGRAVDREGFRIFSRSTGVPVTFIEDAEVTLAPEAGGTIPIRFTDDEVVYGPPSDQRKVAYGEPVMVDGVRFTVPRHPGVQADVLEVRRRDNAIDYLAYGMETEMIMGTGGIKVYFSALEPDVAAPAVNAIVEEYKKVNAENARENVQRRREFLEGQLGKTDSMMMAAQSGLSSFRAREQAYSASSEFTAEQSNLISVEIQQAQLQADVRMFQNLLERIQQERRRGGEGDLSSLMSLPGIGSDPVVSGLYSQLVQFKTEREGMLAGPWARAPTHPDVRRLDTLIASTEEKLVSAVESHIGSVRAQIGALGSLRGRAAAKMSDLPRTEVQEVYLTQNLTTLQQISDQLRDQYQAVRLEEAGEAGQVEIVELATRSIPQRPSPWRKLFMGLVAGLMLGGGLALVREKLDHSINRPEQIEELALVPNLAVIPAATPYLLEAQVNGGSDRRPLEPSGAEAYRVLRTNLMFSQGGIKTLVVTSAAPGEGKTMTSVNLAAACARQGLKVLLLECDLRRPSLKRYFDGGGEACDFADVLQGHRNWRDSIRPTRIAGLDVVLASKSVSQAAEYFAGVEMKNLLDQLTPEYDLVILDTSPLLVAADAIVLGAIADGVLLVVRATHTERGAVQQAVHQLSLVGARVVGTVLNDPDGTVGRYGTYYDYSAEYEPS